MRNLALNSNVFELLDDMFKTSLEYKKQNAQELAVDVKEDADKFILHADVPGVAKENIRVNYDKGNLSIEVSERKDSELKEGEKVIRTERFFSKKYRSFTINDNIDESNIEAEYRDGVLTLTLPKKESAKVVKQIEVK